MLRLYVYTSYFMFVPHKIYSNWQIYKNIHPLYYIYTVKMLVYWSPNEPGHDKTNKMTVRKAKTQISLGIRPVWSKSSLSAWRKFGSLVTHWAHSEDSGQTGRMPRLICLRWAHSHFVGFVMTRLIFFIGVLT